MEMRLTDDFVAKRFTGDPYGNMHLMVATFRRGVLNLLEEQFEGRSPTRLSRKDRVLVYMSLLDS